MPIRFISLDYPLSMFWLIVAAIVTFVQFNQIHLNFSQSSISYYF